MTIGEKLPKDTISLIRNSSTADERRVICNRHKLSIDLMNALLRRDRNVTEENKKLLDDVVAKCKKNIKSNLKLLENIEQ